MELRWTVGRIAVTYRTTSQYVDWVRSIHRSVDGDAGNYTLRVNDRINDTRQLEGHSSSIQMAVGRKLGATWLETMESQGLRDMLADTRFSDKLIGRTLLFGVPWLVLQREDGSYHEELPESLEWIGMTTRLAFGIHIREVK